MAKKKVVEEMAKNVKAIGSLQKNYIARFFSYQKTIHFAIPKLDENGKPEFKTDNFGNNRQPVLVPYEFKPIPVIDELSKKIRADEFECYFDVTEDMPQKEQLLKYFGEKVKSVVSKIVTEEEYIRRKNPVAFETASKHSEETDKLNQRIAELEAQLKNRK